jgi:GNAT superfamily N-acetyltransferase
MDQAETEFHIRPAREGDAGALWPLLEAMGLTDSAAAAQGRLRALAGGADHYLPVAWAGTTPVGYAWAQDYGPHLRTGQRAARLHDLFVTPAWRRRGAGAALLVATVAWAGGAGIRWLEWQASAGAIPFYERLGYSGDPCPDPTHPFFEIEFPTEA